MAQEQKEQVLLLKKLLKEKVLVLDGAMGTMIQACNLTAQDFGGEEFEGCNEYLNLIQPQVISDIHKRYCEAGADIIETNSFGSTPLVLAEYGLSDKADVISHAAASLARKMADHFSTSEKPRFVAGAMGPTTKAMTVTGGITFEELRKHYRIQAEGLYQGGVNFFLLETSQDTRNVKAGLLGIDDFQETLPESERLPIAVSCTIETMGTMLAGQSVEAFAVSLQHYPLLYLGLNCATGPEFMTDHIRSLSEISPFPIACIPNAGLPDEEGYYLETPEMMARVLKNFGNQGWLNLIGGCCGTTPKHIQVFSELAKTLTPRVPQPIKRSFLSGIDFLEVNDDIRPVLVGERTNVIGSRKFKELISGDKYEEASEIGRKQIKAGSHILDICLANPDRDEFEDMKNFLEVLIKKVSVPLMIDSTDSNVIEMALTYSQGRAIINSINLEDGEERFEKVCPLARKYGAAVIVGCIDDNPQQGMGITVERKLQIAERSYKLLTQKYQIPPQDIYWDALVFPCGTGDPQYVGSAVQTIEGVRALKKHFPQTKTILGVSNVSFGLPITGREILNSVFFYHTVQAGLDLAIVNTEKLERYPNVSEEEKKLCEDLIWNRGNNPIQAFNEYFGQKKMEKKTSKENYPLEERLSQYILEGTKEGLFQDLDEALKKWKPLEIVNGPLMKGMDEVGRLFGENKLIVAEVLQSAESMKAAVSYLEPYMEKTDEALRGTMILATVKGDVHDIGKNLVDIIFSNNGFKIVNLGIKIPPQQLIEAAAKHKPNLIGLSGLLVKSAQQMVATVGDFSSAGMTIPVLVGGAALSRNFTDLKIAPSYSTGFVEYAPDAMTGLNLAKQVVNPQEFKSLQEKIQQRRVKLQGVKEKGVVQKIVSTRRSSQMPLQESPFIPPDFERHVITPPVDHVWSWINPLMLLSRHLGVKGAHVRALEDPMKRKELAYDESFKKTLEIVEALEEIKKSARTFMKAKAVYQFFQAHAEGNDLVIGQNGKERVRWTFQRQNKEEGLCLSDCVNPKVEDVAEDYVCVFVTTAFGPIRKISEEFKEKGEFLKSHALMALALETAEATAEYLHSILRSQWGFPDAPEMTMMDRFQAKYRGRRYSFGYPACPELEYQKQLFELMHPADIGVELTEGFMMSPESSVSALVCSHPQAVYFGVGKSEG